VAISERVNRVILEGGVHPRHGVIPKRLEKDFLERSAHGAGRLRFHTLQEIRDLFVFAVKTSGDLRRFDRVFEIGVSKWFDYFWLPDR
jgi:hypothetical protein